MSQNKSIQRDIITGNCVDGLRVTVLPYSVICRTHCSAVLHDKVASKDLYVWHLLSFKTGNSKIKAALKSNVWFLKANATNSSSSLKGTEWLASLAATSTHD